MIEMIMVILVTLITPVAFIVGDEIERHRAQKGYQKNMATINDLAKAIAEALEIEGVTAEDLERIEAEAKEEAMREMTLLKESNDE